MHHVAPDSMSAARTGGTYERDAVESSDAGADVQLSGYELVLTVSAALELPSCSRALPNR